MIIESLILFVTVLASLYCGALISHVLFNGNAKIFVQIVLAGIVSFILFEYAIISIVALVLITVSPIVSAILLRIMQVRNARRIRQGKYGKENKWAAEIIDAGDEEFTTAMQSLPRREVRDIHIIAESKDELRELMVERYEEVSNW